MKRDLLDLASSFTRRGTPFAMATVVRREGKTSAQVGDMALVTGDGAFHGWIGSEALCAVIERECARALLDRRPCLLCLSSSPDRETRAGVVALPSPEEGTVEVYLAPVVTAPRLVLVGRSPVLSSLATLARAIGYRIDLVVDLRLGGDPAERAADRVFASAEDPRLIEADGAAVMAVVAPAGERDAEEVAGALALDPSYLGVIASRRRFALLRDALVSRGATAAAIERIAHPAGLALGAHDPGEVAVAILAQMVARRNGVVAVNEASVTLSESSEVTSTMDVVVDGGERGEEKAAATASCFPSPVQGGESGATVALRVRASSPAMEAPGAAPELSYEERRALREPRFETAQPRSRARAPSTSPPPSDGTPLPPSASDADSARPDARAVMIDRAIDPVCQVDLVIAHARHAGTWEHRTWYFCSAACKAKFLANPLRYSAFAPPAR
jgi:xanthine dehydrogenase accessory factor